MAQSFRVAVLVGSLRRESYSRKLAKALMAMVPDNLICEIVEIGDLPLYNQDFDDDGAPPPAWTAFRQHIAAFDGLLFVTPEYNRSIPSPLKNALDVGSRPSGKSAWKGKPGGVVSNSPGAMGGFGANHHLRQSLVFLDVPLLAQPEAYVGHVATLLGPDGGIADDASRKFLEGFMAALGKWIEVLTPRDETKP
jgi:chromate reductase